MSINWHEVDILELVESYAEDQKLYHKDDTFIASESDLSERYDEEFEDFVTEHHDDAPALCEHFNNWTDILCKDGVLHPAQYDAYIYVGKYQSFFE